MAYLRAMLPKLMFSLWLITVAALGVIAVRHRQTAVRVAAGLCVGNAVLSILAAQLLPNWGGPNLALFVLDLLTAIGFVWLAIKNGRAWCSTGAGFQIAAVALHVSYFLDSSLFAGAYYTGFVILGFALAASIACGAIFDSR